MAEESQTQTKTANRIRELRQRRGLSLEALATLVGQSVSAVQRLETGESELRVSQVERFAHALKVWPEDIVNFSSHEIPITGVVGSGGLVTDNPLEKHGDGEYDFSELVLVRQGGMRDASAALEIKGQALGPIESGWMALYSVDISTDPDLLDIAMLRTRAESILQKNDATRKELDDLAARLSQLKDPGAVSASPSPAPPFLGAEAAREIPDISALFGTYVLATGRPAVVTIKPDVKFLAYRIFRGSEVGRYHVILPSGEVLENAQVESSHRIIAFLGPEAFIRIPRQFADVTGEAPVPQATEEALAYRIDQLRALGKDMLNEHISDLDQRLKVLRVARIIGSAIDTLSPRRQSMLDRVIAFVSRKSGGGSLDEEP